MRLLFIHDHIPEAQAIERRLGERAQLKIFHSLGEGIRELGAFSWRPDIVVVDMRANPANDLVLLNPLRELIGAVPLLFGVEAAHAFLEPRAAPPTPVQAPISSLMQAPVWVAPERRPDLSSIVESLVEQQRALSQTIVAHRAISTGDVERIAREAAEIAVSRAIEQLTLKLGLDDAEGLRLAIRFARGWDEAKGKFLATLTTGLASAFLLALGAGIVAFARNGASK